MSSAPARSVAPPRVLNIDDLRREAKSRLPPRRVRLYRRRRGARAHVGENCRAFEDVTVPAAIGGRHRQCDLATEVLGTRLELPFMLAPVGSSRLFYPRGEEAAARAAGKAGTGYILSTLSGCRLEDVKAATTGPALVTAVPRRRARRGAVVDRARQGRRLSRAGRHHRHASGGPARARSAERHQGTRCRSTRCRLAVPAADGVANRAG